LISTIAMSEQNLSLDGLSLSDEGLTLNLGTDSVSTQILEHCLIGRVLTDKQIRFSYFKERLSHFWKPGKKVSISHTDNGRYLFQFNHRLDAAKVVDEGPWLFDSFNLLIERIAPGVVPASVQLDHIDIWVQVHQLPFGFIQPKVGQAIGRYLGELKEYDQRNSIHSSYMRLKVRINVNDPLKQSWQVRANEGNYVHILFKYEKLGIFCYLCGLLGHTDKNCPKLFDMEHDDGVRGWGENLRPLVKRMGTSATNKYLKDPIPSRPQPATASVPNFQSAATQSDAPTNSECSNKRVILTVVF
jgi:14-3-3 protein epsilon